MGLFVLTEAEMQILDVAIAKGVHNASHTEIYWTVQELFIARIKETVIPILEQVKGGSVHPIDTADEGKCVFCLEDPWYHTTEESHCPIRYVSEYLNCYISTQGIQGVLQPAPSGTEGGAGEPAILS